MGGIMHGSGYARLARRAWICCLVILTVTESHAAAVAIPGHAGGLAALEEGHIPIAESKLTFSVNNIRAESGTEIPITVNLPSNSELRAAGAETGTYLLIRIIPEGVNISPGMATRRIRVVPLRDVSALRLVSQPGMIAQFQLEFFLIDARNRALAQTTATVNLRPSEVPTGAVPTLPMQEPTAAVQSDSMQEPAVVQPRPQAGRLTPQAEALLLARGNDILKQGGIAAARIIFEELAAYGSSSGALALAQSYDPAHLIASEAPAPPPSLAEARKWYERAVELGNLDAKRRLAEINSGR